MSGPARPDRARRPGVAGCVGSFTLMCVRHGRGQECRNHDRGVLRWAFWFGMGTTVEQETRLERIRARLTAGFAPLALDVVDESAQHAGHAGAAAAGQTHYRIAMTSQCFAGQSRLARSRAVHDVLAEEFHTGLHALSLSLKAPLED